MALTIRYGEPTERLVLPMPGLIFVCGEHSPPAVFAAKRRPETEEEFLYHAPVFNTFANGTTCQGTHHYSKDPTQVPDDFFQSWFSLHGDTQSRSHSHMSDLLAHWRDLDGKEEYPMDDLVYCTSLKSAIEQA